VSQARQWAVAFALVLVSAVAEAAGRDPAANIKSWIDGPIRYIATKPESQTFRSMKTDEDRMLFAEKFWARRDPTPETLLTNEYRQLFWERVQQANELFMDSSKPGWKTDRGKVHILYGPPTDIEKDYNLKTNSTPTSGVGVIRWIYGGRPEGRMDLSPIVVVPFVPDTTGEYKISYDPKLSSVFFDRHAIREDLLGGYERWLKMVSAPVKSELSVMLDLGRMQEVPPQHKILLDQVETIESYQTHPLSVVASRFVHPDSGATVVTTTIDLGDASRPFNPAIVARFEPDAGGDARLLGEDDFQTEDHDGRRIGEGRLVLAPGRYTQTVIVADPVTGKTGLARNTIVVQQATERLRFSDVVLARELESLPYASFASHDEPFILGPFRVLPRVERTLRRGEPVKLLYEIYGATLPLAITYQLQGKENDGRWVNLGRPSTARQSAITHAWELGTETTWPEGSYRILLEVRDSDERLIATNVPFELAGSL